MEEKIEYKIKAATQNEIFFHLKKCSHNFFPPLEERVNINDYAEKIFEKSITFEAWKDDSLVGLIAAYFNKNDSGNSVFISNISVIKNFMQLGIASNLLNMCIPYFKQIEGKEIKLEVNKDNNSAISFYKKFQFVDYGLNGDLILMKLEI